MTQLDVRGSPKLTRSTLKRFSELHGQRTEGIRKDVQMQEKNDKAEAQIILKPIFQSNSIATANDKVNEEMFGSSEEPSL